VIGTATIAERDRPEIQAAITEWFGANVGLAERYANALVTIGIERGMIGPREADRVWERHVLNCAALAPLVPHGSSVVDLGSGAGLPGIPLAIARPDLRILLLEPLLRRVRFLEDCLDRLELPNVTIQRGRGEDGIPDRAEVVVVRAVATLDALARMAATLLVEDGMVLALKGQGAAGEVEQMTGNPSLSAELLTLPAPGRDATVVRITGDFGLRTAPRTARTTRGRRSRP
jgi:16S rRNA (guanine527-N7)-methyltransferase